MQYYTVPLDSALPYYTFTTTFSGTVYTIVMRYNTRDNGWYMDIQDANGNNILNGLPILINRNVTGQYGTLAIPPGTFFATDDSGQGMNPTLYSFGVNNTFWYGDPDS